MIALEVAARVAEGALVSQGLERSLGALQEAGQERPGEDPVLLLHGFPGNERNLDLAQALRRAGWTVVFFHYRGAWGSGGDFSFAHVLEDVARMLDELLRLAAPTRSVFLGADGPAPEKIRILPRK